MSPSIPRTLAAGVKMGFLRQIQGTVATSAAVVDDPRHPSGRPRTASQGRPQAGSLIL